MIRYEFQILYGIINPHIFLCVGNFFFSKLHFTDYHFYLYFSYLYLLQLFMIYRCKVNRLVYWYRDENFSLSAIIRDPTSYEYRRSLMGRGKVTWPFPRLGITPRIWRGLRNLRIFDNPGGGVEGEGLLDVGKRVLRSAGAPYDPTSCRCVFSFSSTSFLFLVVPLPPLSSRSLRFLLSSSFSSSSSFLLFFLFFFFFFLFLFGPPRSSRVSRLA